MTLLYIYRGSDYIYDIIFENYGSIADVTSYEDNGSIGVSGTYENFGYISPPNGPWAPSQYYNYGSVVDVADYEDYGSITATVVYGSRTGQGDGTSSDYGFILDGLSANVEFIGSLAESRGSSEVGRGTLSVSGTKVEKKVASVIGSGTISISNGFLGGIPISAGFTTSFSIAAQETAVEDVSFSQDGTRMYVLGDTGNDITYYAVSTPWNVSTATYTGQFSIGSQDTAPVGFYFKPDGTKFYVLGSFTNRVYQYSCTTAWDLSTASYDSVSFSVASQLIFEQDLKFKPDGTKFYVSDSFGNSTIYQYSCSTPWDLSTASYGNVSYNFNALNAGGASELSSITFNSQGNVLLVINDGTSDVVNLFTLSVPWDLSTISDNFKTLIGLSFPEDNPYDNSPSGLFWKPDDTRLYVSGAGGDKVYQYEINYATRDSFVENPREDTLLGTFSGTKVEKKVASTIGIGTLSSIIGSAESRSISYNQSSILYNNDYGSVGSPVTEFADYGDLGSILDVNDFGMLQDSSAANPFGLFSINVDKVEKKSYNYNQFSIVFYDGTEDYGSIGVSTSYEDNGLIIDFGPYDDFGTIAGLRNETVRSFGTINVSGTAGEDFNGAKIHQGSGTIDVSGSLIENRRSVEIGRGTLSALSGSAVAFGANPREDTALGTFSGVLVEKKVAVEVGSGTINVSGSVSDFFIESQVHRGSGTINASGLLDERRTFSYRSSPYDDYGFIVNASDYDENLGLIIDFTSYIDYGPLLGPYTNIDISGSSSTELFVANPPEDTALGTFSGALVEKTTASEVGSGTINFSGNAITSREGEIIESGSGTINISGSLIENRRSSEIGRGTLSALSGSAVAFGANPREDTALGTFSGVLREKKVAPEVGIGTISISGSVVDNRVASNVGLGTINVSGSLVENRISVEIGIGTLSGLSGSAESKTISYNESSIAIEGDYGSIGSPVTEFADYGSLGSVLEATDFGLLSSPKTPFGLFTISVDKVEKKSYNYNEFSIVFYDGSEDYGSIGVSTSYEDNGLIIDFGPYDDFGTIAGLRNETVRSFGTINVSGSSDIDFIGAKIHEGSGTINISGSGVEKRISYNVGFGTLSALSGSAESKGSNPPEDTALGTFSGVLVEKKVAVEVGSGSINISGDVLDAFIESQVHLGSGTINVSGSLIENRRSVEIGSGTFSILSGSAEVFGANPREDTALGTFSGVLVEKTTASEVGIGTISISGSVSDFFIESQVHRGSGTINASGLLDERRTFSYRSSPYDDYGFIVNASDYDENLGLIIDFTSYIDYGPLLGPYTNIDISGAASAEVFVANPPEDIALGTFSGVLVEKKVAVEVGSGTITLSGDAITSREGEIIFTTSGTIDVSGSLIENRRSVEIGRGTLSALSGSAESKGSNPPEDTALGTFSGVLVEKRTASEVGIGTISISGSVVDNRVASNVGLGTINVSGSLIENRRSVEVGIGTLSGLSGSAESKTISYNESSIAVDGDYGFIGSVVTEFADYGTLGSVLEATDYGILTSPKTPFGLFTISIDKVEKKIYNYNEFSIVFYDGTEDYGSIGVSTSYENNGSIIDYAPYDDFGTISGLRNETVNPFGTINVSGSSEIDFIGAKIHEGSGTINISGSGVEKRISYNVGLGTLSALSGSSESKGSNPPEDTALGTFSGVLREKKTASEVGLGTISISGSVSDFFIESQVHRGSGTINVSGSLNENRRSVEVGFGTLTALSGSASVLGVNPPEDTALGTFSGTNVEKITYNYNETSNLYVVEIIEPYGSINDPVTDSENYGAILDASTLTDSYGYLSDGTNIAAFGTINISGASDINFITLRTHESSGTINASGLLDERRTFSYISSPYDDYGFIINTTDYDENYGLIINSTSYIDYGPLLGPYTNIDISGAASAEVFVANPPEDIALGTFSGVLVEKITASEVGLGTITLSGNAITSREGEIIFTTSGTINVSGSLVENRRSVEIGRGTLSALSGSAVAFGANPREDTALGTFSGVLREKRTASEVGLGTITLSGSVFDSRIISNVGLGTISVSGSLIENRRVSEVGIGTLSGLSGSAESKTISYNESSVAVDGDYGFIGSPVTEFADYGSLGTVLEASDYGILTSPKTPFGLFTISVDRIEKKIYNYNQFSIVFYDGTEDYGSIGVSTSYEDNGSIVDLASYDDFGTIVGLRNETVNPFGTISISGNVEETFIGAKVQEGSGTINISGSLIENRRSSEVGFGTLTALSGSAVAFGANPREDTALGTFSGVLREKRTASEVGLGTITLSGNVLDAFIESQVHRGSGTINVSGSLNENRRSVEVGFGTLTALSGSAVAFGANPSEDTALGTFSGVLLEKKSAAEVGLGTIIISGSAGEDFVGQQIHQGSGTINVSGALIQSFTPATEVGSGSISALSGSAEVFGANPEEDTLFGTFSGVLVESTTASEIGIGTIRVSGDAGTSPLQPFVGLGTINTSGSLNENKTFSYISSPYDDYGFIINTTDYDENYGLVVDPTSYIDYGPLLGPYTNIDISGSAITSENDIFDQNIGSGTITVSVDKVENRTYNYNEFSIVFYDGTEDYGSIGISTSYENNGLIIDLAPYDNFGTIAGLRNETVRSFGTINVSGGIRTDLQVYIPNYPGSGSINISGALKQSFTPATEIGSGTLSALSGSAVAFGANPAEDTALGTFSGVLVEKKTASEVGIGTISISGTSDNANGYVYVGTGTAFGIDGLSESFTSNNESTTLINISGSAIDVFNSVYTKEGSGSVNASGLVTESKSQVYIGSGLLFNVTGYPEYIGKGDNLWVGSGSISIISGSAVVFGANPAEDTALGVFSGSAQTKLNSLYVESGIGTITVSAGFTTDRQVYVPLHTGSGQLSVLDGSAETYGPSPDEDATLFNLSGVGKESFTPATAIGFGTIFTLSGSSESFGANPPEDTALGLFSGASENRFIAVYTQIGIGTINVSGGIRTDLQVYVPNYPGSGSIQISGSRKESFTPATAIGFGTIFTLVGSSESFGANPPEDTALGVFSGTNIEKRIYAFGGSEIVSISGSSSSKKVFSYDGAGSFSALSGSAESAQFNPPEDTVLVTLSGSASAPTTRVHVGAGSFSALSGSAESVGFNPTEDTALFTISGSSVDRFISRFTEVGSGTIQISGSNEQNVQVYVPAYPGSGSISILSGSAEVFGANPAEDIALFNIFGSGRESFTPATYISSGIATISGVGIAVTIPFVPGFVFVQII